jgi:hypothetical protein
MRAPQSLTRADQDRLEKTASASLFGELRGGMADYLWLKADRVLHNGVEMRAMTTGERAGGRRARASHAHGEDARDAKGHAEGETTVVPNREADRRGLMGDLERQVKPFMDARQHHHRDPKDTAALFRLMTWANPRFIPGWIVGANILAGAAGRPKEALEFLKEGESHNPESLEIQTEIGRYALVKFHQGAEAERRFRRAIALGAARPKLSEDEQAGWEEAHRWLFIQLHRAGRLKEAVALARTATTRFPEGGYFRRALQRKELAGEGWTGH